MQYSTQKHKCETVVFQAASIKFFLIHFPGGGLGGWLIFSNVTKSQKVIYLESERNLLQIIKEKVRSNIPWT